MYSAANSQEIGRDFQIFYNVASRLKAKQNLYIEDVTKENYNSFYALPGNTHRATGYLYTPLLAFSMYPLTFLSLATASKIWILANILALWFSIACFVRAFGYGWRDVVAIGVICLVAFRFWPTALTFFWGQFDLLIFAFLSLMILGVSRGNMRLCGIALAILIMLKTWWIGLLLWLVLRRHYRAAAWAGGTLLVTVPTMFGLIGWNQVRDLVAMTKHFSVQEVWLSQSIPGFIRAHFQTNSLMEPWTANPVIGYALGAIMIALVAAGFLLTSFKPSASPEAASAEKSVIAQEEAWRLSFAVLCLLLVLPLCHVEYFIFLLPLLWLTMVPPRHLKKRIPFAFQATALVIYLGLIRDIATVIPDANAGWLALIPSLPFVFAMILFGIHVAIFRRIGINTVLQPANVRTGAASAILKTSSSPAEP